MDIIINALSVIEFSLIEYSCNTLYAYVFHESIQILLYQLQLIIITNYFEIKLTTWYIYIIYATSDLDLLTNTDEK